MGRRKDGSWGIGAKISNAAAVGKDRSLGSYVAEDRGSDRSSGKSVVDRGVHTAIPSAIAWHDRLAEA
jgi:hypothetical protein